MPTIDTLLLKWHQSGASDSALAAVFSTDHRDLGEAVLTTVVNRGVHSADVYVYFELAQPRDVSEPELRSFSTTIAWRAGIADGALAIDRLQRVFTAPGASRGAAHAFHYAVETDSAVGWQDELFHWYDEEHMPGLAATPGCVRAQRYLNHDHGPYSLACYDLVAAEVTTSPLWLAVRGTQWSSRVRPQFRNTKRTMFRSLAVER